MFFIYKLEISNFSITAASPQSTGICVDDIYQVSFLQSQCLPVVWVGGEVHHRSRLPNEGPVVEPLALRSSWSLPRSDRDDLLPPGEPVHGPGPNHAQLLVGSVDLAPHGHTQARPIPQILEQQKYTLYTNKA